jgi:hypothetical protein
MPLHVVEDVGVGVDRLDERAERLLARSAAHRIAETNRRHPVVPAALRARSNHVSSSSRLRRACVTAVFA